MTSPNGSRPDGPPQAPGSSPAPGGRPATPRKIIPLMPGIARGSGDRRALVRAAVLQVVGHLVIEAVPPVSRSPLFDQARDLLDEAGWGLDELVEAASPGPAQEKLLQTLGLSDTGT
jgi:hypothetical protein